MARARVRAPEDLERRPQRAVAVPDRLRAGACIELYLAPGEFRELLASHECPDGIPSTIAVGLRARSRYLEAVEAFCQRHDLAGDDVPPELRPHAVLPWSFDDLATQDPDRLAATLGERGLPPTWRPKPGTDSGR